jgi:hypothetical protein
MQTLQVAMLGGRGVGKTSLLASIYTRFDELIGTGGLSFYALPETDRQLNKRLKELKQWQQDLGENGGPPGTRNERHLDFELGEKGKRYSLHLRFIDYPGDWIRDFPERVMRILQESRVVIIAIDSPALMEGTGQWMHLHEDGNQPSWIKEAFVELYRRRKVHHPLLVLFVPLRCEHYVQNPNEARLLLRRIREGYTEVFDFLQDRSRLSTIAIVITPVQTLGSVKFSKLASQLDHQQGPTPPDDYRFYFEKTSPNAQYAPVDIDQPLRYILNFLLKEHLKHKRDWGLANRTVGELARALGFAKDEDSQLNRILTALDGHHRLMQAIRPFAEDCKERPPFQLVQGRDLLLRPL